MGDAASVGEPPPAVGLGDVLRGLTVLEVSAGLAGAHCGHALADLGADVVVLRAPGAPPRRLDLGKRVVPLDPHAPRALEAVAAVAAHAALLVEERPADGWPAGAPLAPALLARFPRLRAVALTPYGLDGPKSGWPAHALQVYHAGGHAQLMPNDPLAPGGAEPAPLQAGAGWGEAQAGTLAALAALAALRDESSPRWLDCAKQEALTSLCWPEAVRHANEGVSPTRLAPKATIVGGMLPARDGHVQVAVREDAQWAALATLLGEPGWIDDPRFATRAARTANVVPIARLLARCTVRHEADWLHRRGRDLGVPIAAVHGLRALESDAGYAARGAWRTLRRADGHVRRVPRWDAQVVSPVRAAAGTVGDPEGDAGAAAGADGGSTMQPAAPTAPAPATPAAARTPFAPLAGVRVLDLGWVAMGPYAGYLLAALGADVIHVARPAAAIGGGVDLGAYNYGFDALNTGKTWVSIDLKRPRGAALARAIARRCDVVLDNFRPGVTGRLGLSAEALAALSPRLITLSATTCGHRAVGGPYPGYAPVFAALGGLAAATGEPGGPPVEVSHPVDFFAGSVAVLAIVAALRRRDATGAGTHVDLAAAEAVLWSLSDHALALQDGADGRRIGNGHPAIAPHGVWRCRGDNRWIAIVADTDVGFARLCAALGVAPLADDPRFSTAAARLAHREALDAALAAPIRAQDDRELAARLAGAGVAAHPSPVSADLCADPHLAARGALCERDAGAPGVRRFAAPPWRAAGGPRLRMRTRAGEDALRAVFEDLLGLPALEVAALREDATIAPR